jgi:hypothetical protein
VAEKCLTVAEKCLTDEKDGIDLYRKSVLAQKGHGGINCRAIRKAIKKV